MSYIGISMGGIYAFFLKHSTCANKKDSVLLGMHLFVLPMGQEYLFIWLCRIFLSWPKSHSLDSNSCLRLSVIV